MHYVRDGETGKNSTKKVLKVLEEGLSATKRVQSCQGDTMRSTRVGLERQGFISSLRVGATIIHW